MLYLAAPSDSILSRFPFMVGANIKEMKKKKVALLRFRQKSAKGPLALDLQSLYVFAPWQAKDEVKMDGFDASGMGGVTWTYEDVTESMSVFPAALSGSEDGNRWIIMRARDRAGNLSMPLRVPLGYSGAREETDAMP